MGGDDRYLIFEFWALDIPYPMIYYMYKLDVPYSISNIKKNRRDNTRFDGDDRYSIFDF
jgi:hypothetical protein